MGHAHFIEVMDKLPPERQAEVLDFAEFLAARSPREHVPDDATTEAQRKAKVLAALRAAQESFPKMSPLELDVALTAMRAEWTSAEFAQFSMAQAMRGMEDDPVSYIASDLKERWL